MASIAMVRMPGQDRKGPVDLLHQHDSHKLVRPGCGAECEDQIGALVQRFADSVRAPYGEAQGLARIIAPSAKLRRQTRL